MITYEDKMQALREGRIHLSQDNLKRVKEVSDWIDEAARYLLRRGVPSSLALEVELAAKMLIGSFYAYRWRDPIQQARFIADFLEDSVQGLRQLADDEEADQ